MWVTSHLPRGERETLWLYAPCLCSSSLPLKTDPQGCVLAMGALLVLLTWLWTPEYTTPLALREKYVKKAVHVWSSPWNVGNPRWVTQSSSSIFFSWPPNFRTLFYLFGHLSDILFFFNFRRQWFSKANYVFVIGISGWYFATDGQDTQDVQTVLPCGCGGRRSSEKEEKRQPLLNLKQLSIGYVIHKKWESFL